MKYFIGLDLGTTNIKAVVYDETGNEICDANAVNKVFSDGRKSEQNMEDLYRTTLSVLKEVVQKAGKNKSNIVALGFSSQGEGLWSIDKNGNATGMAILWNDGRAEDTVNKIKRAPDDLYSNIKKEIASYIKNGSTLSILTHLKERDTDYYNKIRWIFSCKDYIRYRLTGKISWEKSDASCSMMNFNNGGYAFDVLKKLGLSDVVDKLPPLQMSDEFGGYLLGDVLKDLELDHDILTAGGMLDIAATALGAGTVSVGDTSVIIGTTGMCITVMDKYIPDTKFNGWEAYVSDTFIKGMGSMAATPNQDWVIKELFKDLSASEVYKMIEELYPSCLPGSSGLLYHPHISTAGERAPFFEPRATADFLGIRTNSTRNDMLMAVLEGVVMSLRSCLEGISLTSVKVSGGGAKSRAWCQMLCDCLGVDVSVSSAKETATKGAALLAMKASGSDPNNLDSGFFGLREVFHPNERKKRMFDQLYSIYKDTQESMFQFWSARDEYLKRNVL